MIRNQALSMKRLIDLMGTGALLGATWPLLAFTAVLIRLTMGPGGVFFKQRRPGFQEEPFTVVKFRSMLELFDEEGNALSEGERLTRLGWLLRRLSIDELPQLLNVLRGEMSLVGPRPLLIEYLEKYPPEFRRRHNVKPGITGWAQIRGRHVATFRQRLEMDTWYVDNWSLWLDLKIMALTPMAMLDPRKVRRPDQPLSEVDDLGFGRVQRPRAKLP